MMTLYQTACVANLLFFVWFWPREVLRGQGASATSTRVLYGGSSRPMNRRLVAGDYCEGLRDSVDVVTQAGAKTTALSESVDVTLSCGFMLVRFFYFFLIQILLQIKETHYLNH